MSYNLPYNAVHCSFCPELKGIIKRVKNSKNGNSFVNLSF